MARPPDRDGRRSGDGPGSLGVPEFRVMTQDVEFRRSTLMMIGVTVPVMQSGGHIASGAPLPSFDLIQMLS